MKRLKSIDILRGLSMLWMFLAHLMIWWLQKEDLWLYRATFAICDVLGSSAFLFVAGLSTVISYRNRLIKVKILADYNKKMVKKEYMFRALFILILALIYNTVVAIGAEDLKMIWTWFILLTVAISLFAGWPLLKTSKLFRIFFGAIIWLLNQFIFAFLLPFKDESNIYGLLYYIFYHTEDLNPILSFFSFFLFGTVVGDIIMEIYKMENKAERKNALKSKLIFPLLIIGVILIGIGVFFKYPMFLQHRTFPWKIYTMGILLVLLSILIFAEEFVFVNIKKSYRFLFYFSYYSLSVFLVHNLLYFLFYRQLNAVNIWIYVLLTILLVGLTLRIIYNKWGLNASIKIQLGRLASGITKCMEERKKK
ncbi:MAG: heparan-alpha-glucosaminide N-acetyltransferase domain-containing protein [Promethearchaeota archaeon]